MPDNTRKKFRRASVIYWMLLSYIVVALVWWFISLERQNDKMLDFKTRQLDATIDPDVSPTLNYTEYLKIRKEYNRNRAKHISEGSVFMILILIGAAFVYRSVRRQIRMQQQQQNFMMAVTHELKTPISVARLNLETLQKHKLIRMTIQETARLNFLTNNILIASELEGGGYKTSREELDFSDLLKDCIQDFRNRFPDRIFIEQIEPDADVKGDPLLLQMLINNLLENAIKYSPRETPLEAILEKGNRLVRLQIKDQGPGIAEEEKRKIFNKFYRVGNEATRKTQGTGLGLYLCSRIAKDHNADISVTNNTPHGSNFAVNFHL